MIGKFSQEYEYGGGLIYKYSEALVEDVEDRIISPFQYTETPYESLDMLEHNDGNYEEDGCWKFMGPPFYDSLILGSDVSICWSKKEKLYEVTQVEPELDTIWHEEL